MNFQKVYEIEKKWEMNNKKTEGKTKKYIAKIIYFDVATSF